MTDEPIADLAKERKKGKPKAVPIEQGEDTSTDLQGFIKPKWVHENSGKPLCTLENLELLLNSCNFTCHYNVISKRNEVDIPGDSFSLDNMEEGTRSVVYSRMKQVMMPVDGLDGYLLKIGDKNRYNPVLSWVESKPWDGRSRLRDLYDTITSPETEAKELLIRRWLITAMSLAFRDGVDAAGCLVLQGSTNLGKTWWGRKLFDDDVRDALFRSVSGFDPHDRDSLSQFIRFWIVELGDIGSTFRKADIDALKNFITDTKDILRRPYGHGDMVYPRRTAIIASVEAGIYLHDTINRRFWTIPCTAINSYHKINMQQLWHEVLHLVKGGENWKLEPDELAHILRINKEHEQIDPIEEIIMEKYRWEDFPIIAEWKTATQIAAELGLKNVSSKETRIISTVMSKQPGVERKRSHGRNILLIPALRGAW